MHARSYQISIIINTWDMPKRSNQPHENEIMPKRLVCIKATSSATQEMDMYRDEMKERGCLFHMHKE